MISSSDTSLNIPTTKFTETKALKCHVWLNRFKTLSFLLFKLFLWQQGNVWCLEWIGKSDNLDKRKAPWLDYYGSLSLWSLVGLIWGAINGQILLFFWGNHIWTGPASQKHKNSDPQEDDDYLIKKYTSRKKFRVNSSNTESKNKYRKSLHALSNLAFKLNHDKI